MADERRAARLANLRAIFGAILEYVSRGGPFRMRSDRAADGDLVITMRVEEPDDLHPMIWRRLGRFLDRRRTASPKASQPENER